MKLGVVLVIIAATLCSAGAFFVKIANIAPEAMLAWRFLIPVAVVSVFSPSLFGSLLKAPSRVLLCASILTLIRVGVWIIGIAMVPMSKAVVVLYTWPLFFTLFSFLFLGESVQFRGAIGVVLGFLGVATIGLDPSVLTDDRQLVGLLLMMCVAILNATNYVVFKRQLRSRSPSEVLLYDNIAGAVLLLPFVLTSIGKIPLKPMISVICYGGVVGTLGYFSMYSGLKRVKASTAAALSYIEVVAGASLGIIFLQEPIGPRMVVGAALIVMATFLVRR